jgi:hypothetical protein
MEIRHRLTGDGREGGGGSAGISRRLWSVVGKGRITFNRDVSTSGRDAATTQGNGVLAIEHFRRPQCGIFSACQTVPHPSQPTRRMAGPVNQLQFQDGWRTSVASKLLTVRKQIEVVTSSASVQMSVHHGNLPPLPRMSRNFLDPII